MSYSVEWIEPIYDRTSGDVINAESNVSMINPKGCYNAIDLNRIENDVQWISEDLVARKIYRTQLSLAVKTNWNQSDIPTREDMNRIINNVKMLMSVSNPEVQNKFQPIYESSQIPYSLANDIEYNLQIMHDQPELPIQYWYIEIENGIIEETGESGGWFAEDTVIHIKGVEYGEYAQYQTFEHWSGDPNDLQYVENVNDQETTFVVQFHETKLTANFKTILPRKLTINSGYISETGEITTSGPSTGIYFAGDRILIIANRAASNKAFYKWEGTKDALDNLTGASEQDPSTCMLVMPDCDVTLSPKYINAGQHYVTVNSGTGGGWKDYNEYVYIYPNDKGAKYKFSYWSGDTGYLESVTSFSFRMPDVNVTFTANYEYIYSYNTIDMIDGTINGLTKGENLREGSSQSISAIIPEGYGFDYWSLEGVGSFSNQYASNTTFYVGDGNAIITAHFRPLHTLTVINKNNTGGTSSWNVTEGKTTSIDTNEFTSDKTFEYWEDEDGVKYTSRYREFSMPNKDKIFTAHYRNRNTWKLTLNDNGNVYIYEMLEGSSRGISPRHTPSGYRFSSWSYSGSVRSFQYTWSANATIQIGNGNATATVNYSKIPDPDPPKVYHTLTVNNGSGSGSYYEGQYYRCYGNQAPSTYEFAYWTDNSGNIISYSNPYTGYMGTSDITITANYKPIPYFTVTVLNGTGSGTYLRGSYPTIQMNPAPEGMKFLQWEVLEGTGTVESPLAETTRIANLSNNITVQATYYEPSEEEKNTLTVLDKNGDIKLQDKYYVGQKVTIYADEPDEGWEFLRWTGDDQYLLDKRNSETVVNMPDKNITLKMKYGKIGAVETFYVLIQGGEVLVDKKIDEETGEASETWDTRGEFPEGSIVEIRSTKIDKYFQFNCWKNADDGDQRSITTVNDINKSNTYLTVKDFDITLARDIKQMTERTLTVNNGETSGRYYSGDSVAIYWNVESTDTEHHTFIRWSGNDLAYLKNFDIYDSGQDPTTGELGGNPQIITMPDRDITITGTYSTAYKVVVNGGKITLTDKSEGYYANSTILTIKADEPEEGKLFYCWEGDTSCLDHIYNPTAKITVPKGSVEITAKYISQNDRNYIGYTLTDLYKNDTINRDDIIIISGEIETGFIITDVNGHIYVITQIIDDVIHIMRLTKTDTGPEEEEVVENG